MLAPARQGTGSAFLHQLDLDKRTRLQVDRRPRRLRFPIHLFIPEDIPNLNFGYLGARQKAWT